MKQEDIIRMAREAGFNVGTAPQIERFAELVRADEREACAKVCDAEAKRALWNWHNDILGNQPFWNGGEQLASSCANAIRARGQA